MKKLIALIGILIILKSGLAYMFPGDGIVIINGDTAIVYGVDQIVKQEIPMEMIAGIGTLSECPEPEPEPEIKTKL